ncbi:type II toxin-antitoxin system PemK/MazF family toxin [Virgibacillus sp. MSJ-26]|uniref:type II toxin-antitoxin system PemK/MazF family toxin n=1 Tax=Virgibacillus sp. MSJ-26 TaxID=2841522 RepID=UPI001C1170F8|nr:type II toxin-antitoxin system PemK/MazF family toxin [Virgibacillus sp. MSJ-26]MBU5468582.1 type II toxin-antitoxin system PemK/MazF family toxin [Virgibacillus sp. MSJ-26]
MYHAKQGDIIRLDFNPQKGFEQSGTGLALVVSNNFFNKLSSLALVCPITNTSQDFPLNVNLNEQTSTTGSILCQHIRSVDLKARNAYFIEKVPDSILEEVLNIIHSEL